MAFVPILGRFMDGSFKRESREREGREGSLRSSTHYVDATAAHASAPPESERAAVSVVEAFASRWRNADKEYGSDKICTRVWEEHKILGMLGHGRFARTFKVRQKSTGKVLALKLCTMRRLGRGFSLPSDGAAWDHKHEATFEYVGLGEEIAWNVQALRLERTLLRCLTGLCPFVMEIATDCGFSCIFDDLHGQLGYPMSADIGSLKTIWYSLDSSVTNKENEQDREALQELVVFWAAQMADALHFLHQCNIIHADYRPANFVMRDDLYIRLIDFGHSFVDAGQELLSSNFKLPRSLDGFNASRKDQYRHFLQELKFGVNGEVHKTRSAGILEETDENELIDKELVQLEKRYDFFKLGKTLFSFQWPFDRKYHSLFDKMYLPEHVQNYRYDNPSPPTAVISGDLLDFLNHLIADHTWRGVGFTHSNDLIRHRVFRDINFDELRAKRIRLSLRVKFWMGDILNKEEEPLDVTLQQLEKEKEYCGKLSEKEKQVFRLNYIG